MPDTTCATRLLSGAAKRKRQGERGSVAAYEEADRFNAPQVPSIVVTGCLSALPGWFGPRTEAAKRCLGGPPDQATEELEWRSGAIPETQSSRSVLVQLKAMDDPPRAGPRRNLRPPRLQPQAGKANLNGAAIQTVYER